MIPKAMDIPLRWRKPRQVFVCSASDLFHKDVLDEYIAEVFGVMAVAGHRFGATYDAKLKRWRANGYGPHTFQVLTKRPERMKALLTSGSFRNKVASHAYKWAHDRVDAGYLADTIGTEGQIGRAGSRWPLPNVWLGVSCENQETADERIPLLLQCPAAVRWVSAEPLLGPIDLMRHRGGACKRCCDRPGQWCSDRAHDDPDTKWHVRTKDCRHCRGSGKAGLDWVVVGGESGGGARPCGVSWIGGIVRDCDVAGVPVFVKQLGARPFHTDTGVASLDKNSRARGDGWALRNIHDPKGGSPDEWPKDLRIREFPRPPS